MRIIVASGDAGAPVKLRAGQAKPGQGADRLATAAAQFERPAQQLFAVQCHRPARRVH
jgi:hypothetical protein